MAILAKVVDTEDTEVVIPFEYIILSGPSSVLIVQVISTSLSQFFMLYGMSALSPLPPEMLTRRSM